MTDLFYLVWGPLGFAHAESFVRAYRAHPPGEEHSLAVIYNGVAAEQEGRYDAVLSALDHRVIRLEHPVTDLAAYRLATEDTDGEVVCFLNSYSEPLADGWLAKLTAAARQETVGMAGATGTWESASTRWWRDPLPPGSAPGRLKAAISRRLMHRTQRRDYAGFPNPHLRTNAFALRRNVMAAIDWRPPTSRNESLLLESGRNGFYARIDRLGLSSVVVDRDGRILERPEWPDARVYRSGEQELLLVADNRTRDYASADAEGRGRLRLAAFGESGSDGSRSTQ